MSPDRDASNYYHFRAMEDFSQARRKAAIEQVMARLGGKPGNLLSYNEVRQKLKASETNVRILKEIPLDAIVGSVNRYTDFTRGFLPTEKVSGRRWAGVKMAVEDLAGLPPIDVYQIGDVFFVLDGNHRVSVAKSLGASTIQAYVTVIKTRVPLSPQDNPDRLILKAEYTNFLVHTRLDEVRPEADLQLTAPGQYTVLREHLDVHKYYLSQEQQREVTADEAAASFYDNIYLPVVQAIRETGILRYFPHRTEADLYLWVTKHRTELQDALNMEVSHNKAAQDLVDKFAADRKLTRLSGSLIDNMTPDSLESGPPVGAWRQQTLDKATSRHLFQEVLVPVSGEDDAWTGLSQAFVLAQREFSQLNGVHVVPTPAQTESPEALAVQQEYLHRCQEAGVRGRLVVLSGQVPRLVCERARWNDLAVINLKHPPGVPAMERLSSGFRTILRRCPTPVLAVPRRTSALEHALLAYNASPKAQEALYLSAYLAGKWGIRLSVVVVEAQQKEGERKLAKAREYLENQQINAEYQRLEGDSGGQILRFIEEYAGDFIITGGYGLSPLLELMMGSTLDTLLRGSRVPILICR